MISYHVSAVLLVRDSFTGQVLEGGGLSCVLDGVPLRPVAKPGGYLVLVNLPEGGHQLRLRAARFREELVDFTAQGGETVQLYPVMKPGEAYFFRYPPARLALTLKKAEQPVWLAPPGTLECKLAQAKTEPGAREVRLFCKGGLDRLPIPGPFLLEDGKKSEITVVESFRGESAQLAAPLAKGHGRNCRLLPAGQYRVENGVLTACFPQPGTVFVLNPGREGVQSVELAEGENQAAL